MAKSFSFNPFTGNFDLISQISLAAVGSSPNANGASLSAAQVLNLQPFSSSFPGVVTASGGGTANFLRADGSWATPPDTGITQLTGDVTAGPGSGSQAATIAANAVTDAKFRQSAGLSLVGRSANTTGNVADITAASDGQIMRRSGTTIGFGSIDLAASAAVGASVLTVPNGGSGVSSHTAYAVICGGTTSTGAEQSIASVGTSGQVLTSNGAGALPTFQAVSSAGFTAATIQVFTSSGTYTKPSAPAPLYVKITVTGSGAGGNSGAATSGGGGGGGGGAGGTAIRILAGASVGATETVTVGAGGAQAASGNTSSLGTLAVAGGGSTGNGGSGNLGGGGGGAGAGTTGSVLVTGGSGCNGLPGQTGAVAGLGGNGGGSFWGTGGVGDFDGGNGRAGVAYGSGGGGGRGAGTATVGGAGAPGIVIVEEYYQ